MEITGRSINEYTPDGLLLVKRTCLTIAQTLGDAMEKDAVIVGGLVPVLLYQNVPPVWSMVSTPGRPTLISRSIW